MALHLLRYQIAAPFGGLYLPTCLTATHFGGSALFHMFHCLSLGWLHIVSGASLPLMVVACVISSVFLLFMLLVSIISCVSLSLIGVAISHFRYTNSTCLGSFLLVKCTTATHRQLCFGPGVDLPDFLSDAALFQMSICCFLGSLSFFPGVPLKLIGVALCSFTCLTEAPWCSYASSNVFHCYSLAWLKVVTLVSLALYLVALSYFLCFTSAHWGNFVSFLMSQFHSLGWLCVSQISHFQVILGFHCCSTKLLHVSPVVQQQLTMEVLCCSLCPTSTQ